MIRSKEILILKVLVSLFVLACLYNFLVEPLYKENKSLSEKIMDRENILIKYKQMLNRKDAIQSAYKKIFPSKDVTEAEEPTVKAFKELEAMAKNNSIKIIDIRQQGRVVREFTEILIELRLQAKEEDYIRFIYALKNSPLLFRIESFTFKPQRGTPLLEARFAISYISSL